MNKKTKKFLYWLPRILAIVFIAFISLFALDVFSANYSFGQTLVALFMHLIPTLSLLIVLWLAWKWETIGGLVFIGLGIYYFIGFDVTTIAAGLIVAGPPILIGLLFMINDSLKKK